MERGSYSGGSAVHHGGSGWYSAPFSRIAKKVKQKEARKKCAALEKWAVNLEDGWTHRIPRNAEKTGIYQNTKVKPARRRQPLSVSCNPEVAEKHLRQQEERMKKVEIVHKRRKRPT